MGQPMLTMLRRAALPASWAYRRVIDARNARFDAGHGVQRLDRPVISIGNITVGGTGKSPMVQWVAALLREAGHVPVIAMRGYGAARGEKNDEQLEYEWRLPGVPIVADPDRHAALTEFLQNRSDVDCVVLDDGFQHRQLHRDLDLVLLDASANTFDDVMLPAGRLREPLGSLRRADGVIVTRCGAVDPSIGERVQQFHGGAPVAWAEHRWSGLLIIERGEQRCEDVRWLDGRRVLTLLGVGHPRSVEAQIKAAGARIAARIPARDHERYDRATLVTARGLCEGVDAMVMTAKDWVKVRRLIDSRDWPSVIVVPVLEMHVHQGEPALRELLRSAMPGA